MTRVIARRGFQATSATLLIGLTLGTAGIAALLLRNQVLNSRRGALVLELRKAAQESGIRIEELRTLTGEILAAEYRRWEPSSGSAPSFAVMARCSTDPDGVPGITVFRRKLRDHELAGRFHLNLAGGWQVESSPVREEDPRIEFTVLLVEPARRSLLASR